MRTLLTWPLLTTLLLRSPGIEDSGHLELDSAHPLEDLESPILLTWNLLIWTLLNYTPLRWTLLDFAQLDTACVDSHHDSPNQSHQMNHLLIRMKNGYRHLLATETPQPQFCNTPKRPRSRTFRVKLRRGVFFMTSRLSSRVTPLQTPS